MANSPKCNGFTLIELMIVIAILAILMAIAIPAYQDYNIRSQVSEGMNLAGGARVAVWDRWAELGEFPSSNSEAGLPGPLEINGDFVERVDLGVDGQITVTFRSGSPTNAAIRSATLMLTPSGSIDSGSVVWTCDSGSIGSRYLPARCR